VFENKVNHITELLLDDTSERYTRLSIPIIDETMKILLEFIEIMLNKIPIDDTSIAKQCLNSIIHLLNK
jgi:hypothetical protein